PPSMPGACCALGVGRRRGRWDAPRNVQYVASSGGAIKVNSLHTGTAPDFFISFLVLFPRQVRAPGPSSILAVNRVPRAWSSRVLLFFGKTFRYVFARDYAVRLRILGHGADLKSLRRCRYRP